MRATTLLAILVALPFAFLALIPSGVVEAWVYDLVRIASAIFPFKAALDAKFSPLDAGDFIGKWMSMLGDLPGQLGQSTLLTDSERQRAMERISIRNSISNLRTFPYVADLEAQGKKAVHGAWFDISTGELWVMDAESGDFVRPEF